MQDAWQRLIELLLWPFRIVGGNNPPSHPHALGTWGERQAARHLKKTCRYRLRDKNVRVRGGDVDLVMEGPDGAIVFVEVKTRRVHPHTASRGEDAITRDKCRRLLLAARTLASERKWEDRPLRIDVVVVELRSGSNDIEIRHSPNAVSGNR